MTTTPDPTPTPETPMPDRTPPADIPTGLDTGLRAHTACTSTFRVAGDPPCDVHRDGVHRCDPQIAEHGEGHKCECGQEWTPAEAAMASNAGLDALVGRFNALSDAAGNPGARPSGTCAHGIANLCGAPADYVMASGRPVCADHVHAHRREPQWDPAPPGNPGAPTPTCPARYCLTGSHTHTCTRPYAHPDRGHHCACGDGWSANPDELPHPFRQAAVDDTECEVCGRDVADLLHTSGPGPGVYEAAQLARAAASHYGPGALPLDTGNLARYGTEHSRARTPGTPEGALSYALGHAEREGRTLLQARDVLAGLTELGWTLHPGLPHPAVLAQIHERLDRIEYVTENIAAAVDDPPPVDRTLAAMDRVTQTDAEAVVYETLMGADLDPERANGAYGARLLHAECTTLAAAVAEALYGPTTETAPTVDWFTRAGANDPTADVITRARRWLTHCGPDRGVSDTIAGMHLARLVGELLEAIPDEGAPTEGDRRGRGPLIPAENWTSTDTEGDG